MFVGSVADTFDECIEQKIFHCEIVVDAEKVNREEKVYKKILVITVFETACRRRAVVHQERSSAGASVSFKIIEESKMLPSIIL